MSVEKLIPNMSSTLEEKLQHLNNELSKIRSGRVTSSIVDNVKVDAYENIMPLNQVATIITPDARTINIEPWDKGLLEAVEKALLKADLGSNPTNDGNIIRLNFPPLSEERRKELVKTVKKITEECKVSMRKTRREALDQLHLLDKEISKDDIKRTEEKIQKTLNDFEAKVDAIVDKKETELLTI